VFIFSPPKTSLDARTDSGFEFRAGYVLLEDVTFGGPMASGDLRNLDHNVRHSGVPNRKSKRTLS